VTVDCRNCLFSLFDWGHRWWLRHCATSRKVVCSVPDEVIGIFYLLNPSGCPLGLSWTQPLREMNTRGISWGGKGGKCIELTTLLHSCTVCLGVRSSTALQVGRSWVRFSMVSFEFFIDIILPAALWPRGRLSL